MIDDLMMSIINTIDDLNRVDIIECDNDCVVVSELGFDEEIIEIVERECDVLLDYDVGLIDDIVEIRIRC